jgi:DNA-binding Xre family transcriptional regulator
MGQVRKRLAKKIRALRGEIPLRNFARRLGIAKSTLHRIEMEENISLETLEQICKALKCDITELFEEVE